MDSSTIAAACEHLRQGDVIAYPTEAVWGLGCDPWNQQAVMRILAIKQRPVEKGLILVAAGPDQLGELLAPLSDAQRAQLKESWPGPVTFLIPDPQTLIPAWIRGEHDSAAIRVSAHPLVQKLCREFGKPVVSTSANLAGKPAITSRDELEQTFAGQLDYIVEGELGDERRPSEIRDLSSGQVIR